MNLYILVSALPWIALALILISAVAFLFLWAACAASSRVSGLDGDGSLPGFPPDHRDPVP